MSRALGAALQGVDGMAVEVEVRISSLLPRVDIVGLPEAAVRESAARVRAAIGSVGHRFPDRRVTVNLAPAWLRKSGAGLDLPIAVGILSASGNLEAESLVGRLFVGELALDGRLRPVRGALAMALVASDLGCREAIFPWESAPQAALAPGVRVLAARDLGEVIAHLMAARTLPVAAPPEAPVSRAASGPCLGEVRGQGRAKRALEVAAAGGHGLLLVGPPGSGKTMLAQRLPGLLPPMDPTESVEATRIHGAAGCLDDRQPVVRERPFRAPHHTASTAGLLGGGSPPRPGEVSLAHRGVLFLDELPEFDRRSLEALRQVLEEHRVAVVRARGACVFPADFQLVAAANPCPCGWYGTPGRDCRCDEMRVARYLGRLSGPLLDRIDLHVNVTAVAWRELDKPIDGPRDPSTDEVRKRVLAARTLQSARGVACNAAIPDRQLDALVDAQPRARALLGRAVDRLQLSARCARRVLRIARTISDLSAAETVGEESIAEALSYRGAS